MRHPRRPSDAPNQTETENDVATDREPPFEGGSQPVKQEPPRIPPSRPSPRMGILLGLIVLFLLAGLVFVFAH